MLAFLAVVLACFWAITAFQLWRLSRPARQRRMADKTARRLDLALDEQTRPLVQNRLVRRERVALVATAVLETAYLPVALALDHSRFRVQHANAPIVFVLPFLIFTASRPLLLSLLMAYDALRRQRDPGPRVARVVVTRLTDYVRPVELWAARFLAGVVVPACALIVGLTQQHRADEPWLSGAVLVATALSAPLLLAVAELGAHQLVALPQPASTPTELAWDDALRSMQLRELFVVVTGGSLMISVLSVAVLDSSFIAVYGVIVVMVLLGFAGSPASHYRRRLWPWPTEEQAT